MCTLCHTQKLAAVDYARATAALKKVSSTTGEVMYTQSIVLFLRLLGQGGKLIWGVLLTRS
jgi:hypothetical protein